MRSRKPCLLFCPSCSKLLFIQMCTWNAVGTLASKALVCCTQLLLQVEK